MSSQIGIVTNFQQTPDLYNTNDGKEGILEIARGNNNLQATDCLVTLFPASSGSLRVAHLVSKSIKSDELDHLRNWWGKADFNVDSAVNLIMLEIGLLNGFDNADAPQWTIVPKEEVVRDIYENFVKRATIMLASEREEWYKKYDVRTGSPYNTYRFVPLNILTIIHPPILRLKEPLIHRQTTGCSSKVSADLSSPAHLEVISSPYRHQSLQTMTSHAHPFAVIVKAAGALALHSHLVPEEFREVSILVQQIAFKWGLEFPASATKLIRRTPPCRSVPDVPSDYQPTYKPRQTRDTNETRQPGGTSLSSPGDVADISDQDSKSNLHRRDSSEEIEGSEYGEQEFGDDEVTSMTLSKVLSLAHSVTSWRGRVSAVHNSTC